jgi:hypothetical protein
MDAFSPMTATGTAFTLLQSTVIQPWSSGIGSLVPFDRLQTPDWSEHAQASA